MNKKTLSVLGLFVLLLLCICRYVFLGYFTSHSDDMQNNSREHVGELAFSTLADSLEYVATKIELFEFVDLDENLENVPKREIVSQLSKFKNSFYYVSSIYLALENGQYYETTSTGGDQLGTENQEWYYLTKKNLKTNFLTATKNNKTNCGIIATPFYYNGKYSGVIAVEIDNALFKKTADYFGDNLAQLVISDDDDNPLFVYDKNFEENDKYDKASKTYLFMTHSVKGLSKFNATTYILKTGSQRPFRISTWAFTFVFLILIVVTIVGKWKNNKDITVGTFLFKMILVMLVEITACLIIFIILYHKNITIHEGIVEKYLDQMDANSKYLSETIGFRVQDDKLFTKNELLTNNSREMNTLIDIYNHVKKNNRHCINFFFISKDGDYQNFPSNPTYTARDFNFQINRRLLNGSDRSTYVTNVDMETWQLKEYVFKMKDDRNNYIGTFGVNLIYDVPEDTIARCFDKNSIDKYIEYKNGVVTLYYLNRENKNGSDTIKFEQEQIDKLEKNDYGIIETWKGFKKEHYVYFKTIDGESKRLIPISLNIWGNTEYLFIISFLLIVVTFALAILLDFKEKTNTTTYENVEEKYEIELMENEDRYFEMLKNDEEVEKGMKVMKIWNKKPTEEFAKKIKEYFKRKNKWN